MKALILNSGMGTRLGVLTSEHPKCMTCISDSDTILSRQLKLLAAVGVTDVVMTTGYFSKILEDYCYSLNLPLNYSFVYNPIYNKTNYIYSIYCAKDLIKGEDILLLHGDLVFELSVLKDILAFDNSCMKVSSTLPLPEKDFKAVVKGDRVMKVGVEYFDSAVEAQALYKLNKREWNKWLDRICEFCENDKVKCYAEAALNEITENCEIYAYDVNNRLCSEIDTVEDLKIVSDKLKAIEELHLI